MSAILEARDLTRRYALGGGTGLSLTAAETPQAISTLTHQQLEDQGLTTVNDALDQAAGVTVERVETDRTYFTSRGFDVQNFQLDGFGLPFTNGAQWGDLDTAIYDHIDILRGANGLMTGTGLPSATVNFALKKPTAAFQPSNRSARTKMATPTMAMVVYCRFR